MDLIKPDYCQGISKLNFADLMMEVFVNLKKNAHLHMDQPR